MFGGLTISGTTPNTEQQHWQNHHLTPPPSFIGGAWKKGNHFTESKACKELILILILSIPQARISQSGAATIDQMVRSHNARSANQESHRLINQPRVVSPDQPINSRNNNRSTSQEFTVLDQSVSIARSLSHPISRDEMLDPPIRESQSKTIIKESQH
jgi:hypothetical protein